MFTSSRSFVGKSKESADYNHNLKLKNCDIDELLHQPWAAQLDALQQISDSMTMGMVNREANRVALLKAGGLNAVDLILRDKRLYTALRERSCCVISQLVGDEASALAALETQTLDEVVTAMIMDPHSDMVQTYAATAIASMASNSQESARRLIAIGAIEALSETLKNFAKTDVNVIYWVICAFESFNVWEELRTPIIKAGGLRALCNIVEIYHNVDDDEMCFLVTNGFRSPEVREKGEHALCALLNATRESTGYRC